MNIQIRTYSLSNIRTQSVVREITNYVKTLSLPDSVKKEILSFDFINDNPSYYVDYPYLFVKDVLNERKINRLCIAGALYYQSIIMIDRVLDKDCPFDSLFPIINICQEETVKILVDLIGSESDFWVKWNVHKMEYMNAFKIDRTHTIHSFKDFEVHADNKSSLGKIAIDALWELGEISSYELYTALLKIHKSFYCAFQLLDDIGDIKEDYTKGQFNVVIWQIKEAVATGKLPQEALDSAEMIAKNFYLSDIRIMLYRKALEYVDEAYRLSIQYGLSYWVEEECRLWNTIVLQTLNIDAYIKELEAALSLSNIFSKRETVNSAISDGIFFIESRQEEDGSWVDFCNNAGTSNTWSTAFVLFILNETGEKNIKAVQFLLEHKKKDLWGYNTCWISDNDSSIMALLALQASVDISMDIDLLLERFNRDGGVSTYFDESQLVSSLSNVRNWNIDTSGWTQSHLCVSAAALLLLARSNDKGGKRKMLLEYIKRQISNETHAYWWVDDIYVLFFLQKANDYLKKSVVDEYLEVAIEKRVRTYNDSEVPIFYKSLLLYLMCFNESIYVRYREKVEVIVQEILCSQYKDGSWKESNYMCIPSTETLNPNEPGRWEVANKGVNVRAHEFHRLFTTSVTILGLKQYREIQNERI